MLLELSIFRFVLVPMGRHRASMRLAPGSIQDFSQAFVSLTTLGAYTR